MRFLTLSQIVLTERYTSTGAVLRSTAHLQLLQQLHLQRGSLLLLANAAGQP